MEDKEEYVIIIFGPQDIPKGGNCIFAQSITLASYLHACHLENMWVDQRNKLSQFSK